MKTLGLIATSFGTGVLTAFIVTGEHSSLFWFLAASVLLTGIILFEVGKMPLDTYLAAAARNPHLPTRQRLADYAHTPDRSVPDQLRKDIRMLLAELELAEQQQDREGI